METTRRVGRPAIRPNLSFDNARLFAYRTMIESIIRREGPSKSRIRVKAEENHPQPLSAGIDPDTWDVNFTIRQGLAFEESAPLRRFLSTLGINDAVGEALRDVTFHEIGHWEYPKLSGFGCPFDKPLYYTTFVEPIHEELLRSGKFQPDECKALSMRFANAVTDIIDNFNISSTRIARRQAFSGQSLFWYLQGQENEGAYSKEYSLFVKLNLALFGNKHDLALLKGFIDSSAELGQAVKRLTHVFSPASADTASPMLSRSHWERLARVYTREAIKFIEPGEGQSNFQYSAGSGNPGQPQQQGGQEGGKEGRQEGGKGQGKGKEDQKEGEDGKGGGQKPEQKPGEDLKKGDKEKIMMGRKAGQGIPFYINTTEGLDAYYSGLSKRIPIKAAGKLPAAQMPLVPLLYEPYDPDVHDARDILMGRLCIDRARGVVSPSVARARLPIDIPIKKEKRNLPDFVMALIDSSGSMMWGGGNRTILPWGDQSYYHYALLAFYGLLRFFDTERILHKMGVSAAIFSDKTLSASGLDEVKKLILNPVSGGTSLDVAKVMESLRGRTNVLFSMISDGEIGNWNDTSAWVIDPVTGQSRQEPVKGIKDEFIALAKRNQFFMIQIGRKSQASRDMEAAGLAVHYVATHKDIVKLAIDLTVQRYRAAIASGAAGEAKKYRNM
jgi:hypothetical protein